MRQQLIALSKNYVEQRIDVIQKEIAALQSSANEETKSSSGDKYETGRAMAQLEIEKNSTMLAEARQLLTILSRITHESPGDVIQPGSVVKTTAGNYFIAIAAGKFEVLNEVFYAISPAAPIAKILMGLKKGDEAEFRGDMMRIKSVG